MMEEKYGLPFCSWLSLTGHFFFFYDLLVAPPFVENQKFAIMAKRRKDAQFLLFARLFIRNPDTEKKKVKIGIRKKNDITD